MNLHNLVQQIRSKATGCLLTHDAEMRPQGHGEIEQSVCVVDGLRPGGEFGDEPGSIYHFLVAQPDVVLVGHHHSDGLVTLRVEIAGSIYDCRLLVLVHRHSVVQLPLPHDLVDGDGGRVVGGEGLAIRMAAVSPVVPATALGMSVTGER